MNRRDFIIKGTVASAALLPTSSLLANSIVIRKKIVKIAVIGTGSRGSGLIPIIHKIANLQLVACCDTIPFRLERGLKKGGENVKGFSNYKELLLDKTIDAVLISTPFSTHIDIANDAIKAGKHIYCEKTLGRGYKSLKKLVNTVQNSNLIFQTGHQYHSSRLYTHIVNLIKDGKVGKIATIESQWNRFTNWRRNVPDSKYERQINWRMYKEFSGGLVAELSSHQIDFVNTILETNPTQVMGSGGIDYWKDGRETFDNIHLIYNYPKGIKAKFTCLTNNAKNGYQIKVIGDKGMIIINTREAKFYPKADKNSKKYKENSNKDVDGVSGATEQYDPYGYGIPIKVAHKNPSKQALIDFKDSILNKTEPISNVVTGARAAVCVQMGLDAMHNNKIIKWPKQIKF